MSHLFFPSNEQDHYRAFAKYHGNGNDFIIFDYFTNTEGPSQSWLTETAKVLCERHRGIGADGIIMLSKKGDQFYMTVINADGTIAANCGNGLRCAALHIFKTFGVTEASINLAQNSYLCQKKLDQISVTMGDGKVTELRELFFASCSQLARISLVHVGNKHLVLYFNEPVDCFDDILKELHQKMRVDDDVNVGFVFKDGPMRFFSRVFERGVGFTNSCGSGACAAASLLAFLLPDEVNDEVIIVQPGGQLTINIHKKAIDREHATYSLLQAGRAEEVFMGICEVVDNC